MLYITVFGAAVLGALGFFAMPLLESDAPSMPTIEIVQVKQVQEEVKHEVSESEIFIISVEEEIATEEEPAISGIPGVLIAGNDRYEMGIPKGSSIYDFMMLLQEEEEFSFKGKNFHGLGFFVEEINGVRQNLREGMHWMYYLNGKKGLVGISQYILQAHDSIEWKYEDEE
jgi:hypothetical protein